MNLYIHFEDGKGEELEELWQNLHSLKLLDTRVLIKRKAYSKATATKDLQQLKDIGALLLKELDSL